MTSPWQEKIFDQRASGKRVGYYWWDDRSQSMRHLRYVESRVTDRKNLPRNESFTYYLKWFVLESHGELDLNQARIFVTNITDIISACDRTLKRKNYSTERQLRPASHTA